MAEVRVDNLRLRTFIGFNPEERRKQQDVVINVTLSYEANRGIADDEVAAALDYKQITKAIITYVESGRFLLLERLVADVLAIVARDDRVMRASVRIDKPHALRFADSVSLTMSFDRESDTPPDVTCRDEFTSSEMRA
ncbi:MAG: dihydroneopterin triphosphate 2'-epimerase [Pseudomonadota bacterium]